MHSPVLHVSPSLAFPVSPPVDAYNTLRLRTPFLQLPYQVFTNEKLSERASFSSLAGGGGFGGVSVFFGWVLGFFLGGLGGGVWCGFFVFLGVFVGLWGGFGFL